MVESVGKVGVGRVGARAGSRTTSRDTGPSVDDAVWAKRVACRSNRRASAIRGVETRWRCPINLPGIRMVMGFRQ